MANAGSWKKGQSGNPGGRCKVDYEIREKAKGYTKIALETLAHVCQKAESETARVAAAVALLDRGWGKPAQSVEVTNPDGSMSQAWLAAIRAVDGMEPESEASVEH